MSSTQTTDCVFNKEIKLGEKRSEAPNLTADLNCANYNHCRHHMPRENGQTGHCIFERNFQSALMLPPFLHVCPAGGAVLVVEALLYEDGSGPVTAQLYSLNMLVQTEGKERTAAQYAALMSAAGFTNIQHRLTGKIYDAVLGHKED